VNRRHSHGPGQIEACATRAFDSALELTGFSRPGVRRVLEILASLRFVVEAIHGSLSIVRRKHCRPAIRIKPASIIRADPGSNTAMATSGSGPWCARSKER
jgi:hypothetical protein